MCWIYGEIGSEFYLDNESEIEKMIERVMKCLDMDLESELTKGWILNAMAKLSVSLKRESRAYGEMEGILKKLYSSGEFHSCLQ